MCVCLLTAHRIHDGATCGVYTVISCFKPQCQERMFRFPHTSERKCITPGTYLILKCNYIIKKKAGTNASVESKFVIMVFTRRKFILGNTLRSDKAGGNNYY